MDMRTGMGMGDGDGDGGGGERMLIISCFIHHREGIL